MDELIERREVEKLLSDAQQRIAVLEGAAIMLIGKIKRIHNSDEYRAVWECAQNHRGPYHGESYENELIALSALLAAYAPDIER